MSEPDYRHLIDPDAVPAEALIAVGRFIKPHGLRGELVFLPYVVEMELLPDLIDQPVRLQHPVAPVMTRKIWAWRYFNKRVLMRLEGCRDVSQAEGWRDYEMCIPRQSFPALPDGEFYWFEIEGLTVYACDGSHLGSITEIIHTGSNDVYVVRDGAHEILVPALKDTVRSIDVQRGEMHLLVVQEWLK